MTVQSEPIPDVQYGAGNWADYVNNWREYDAEWLQARTILRFTNATTRDAAIPSPGAGQVVYNNAFDYLEMRSNTGSWKAYKPLPTNLASGLQDDVNGVSLAHSGASGKGILLTPTQVQMSAPLNVLNNVMLVDTTGVNIKVGAKTAKLSTDATNLVSDSPFSAPALISTGTLTVTGAFSALSSTLSTTLTAPNINMSGTLTGGILNGSRGLIGGVNIGYDTGLNTPAPATSVFAPNGYISQQGYFYGDATSAYLRQRTPTTGAMGSQYLQITSGDIYFGPTNAALSVYMAPYLRIMQGHGVPWHNAAGTHIAWISPVIYSGSDPGAANYPDGTLWLS